MSVVYELAEINPSQGMVLTIGVFDGVHPGHQYLISRVKEKAREAGCLSGVVTFDRHPTALLNPEAELPYLTSLSERIELIKRTGVDHVIILSFTQELAQLTSREFVTLLRDHLMMRELVVGPDFALGKGREGSIDVLYYSGQELGFTVDVVPPVMFEGEAVSSTAIRQSLEQGNVESVTEMLGRRFRLSGMVTYGDDRGGELLGFPTANLNVNSHHAQPATGTYITLVHVGQNYYRAVTNIGVRPTFGVGPRTMETYLLDFNGELYGKEMGIEFVKRLRGEAKFNSPQDLRKQIERDVITARETTIETE